MVTSNGDACVVLFHFVGADFAYDTGVGDLTSAVLGDGMVVNGPEGIRALDALLGGVTGVRANTLAEASQFVGIGCVPHCLVGWMPAHLAMFE